MTVPAEDTAGSSSDSAEKSRGLPGRQAAAAHTQPLQARAGNHRWPGERAGDLTMREPGCGKPQKALESGHGVEP